jgi:flagellar biosynthesis protein FlhF
LSIDCYRIAAAEQLRSYGAILGVGFQAHETTLALAQALEEHRHKDLILIDTPGYGPKDMDAAEDLARLLASRPDVDTHLVLTASMKSADLKRVVDRFEVFRPRKLLFTKLDETETFGPILNEAVRTGKPVSFLSAGQQIPDDLEPATPDRILELALRRERVLAPAAAA